GRPSRFLRGDNAMSSQNELILKIIADAKALEESVGDAEKKVRGSGEKISGIAGQAGSIAGKALSGGIAQSAEGLVGTVSGALSSIPVAGAVIGATLAVAAPLLSLRTAFERARDAARDAYLEMVDGAQRADQAISGIRVAAMREGIENVVAVAQRMQQGLGRF